MMSSSNLAVDVGGAVATITLNRPSSYNALTADLVQALIESFAAVEKDVAVKAIILTGAGKAFCAGQALDDARTLPRSGDHLLVDAIASGYNPLVSAIMGSSKIVIAAVNGV